MAGMFTTNDDDDDAVSGRHRLTIDSSARDGRRFLWQLRTNERGSVTVELVVAMPLLMLLILLIAQFTLYLHAAHVAQAAAAEALSVARIEGGTSATGQADAQQMLKQLASGPLRDPHVTVARGATAATVEIQGTVTAVIPFVDLTVTVDSAGPVERFVPDR
jgi:Flp pilus assembly protein TadG